MNLLYLSQRLPYPPNKGDRIATYNHIKYLSRKHRVFVAALTQSEPEEGHLQVLREISAGLSLAKQGACASSMGMVFSLIRGQPLTLGHFRNHRLQAAVDRTIRENGIQAAIAFSSSMAQYLQPHRGLVRIMHFCDIDSQKWNELAKQCSGLKRWIYRRESKLLLEYERQVASNFAASCVVAECAAVTFRKLIPGIPIHVIENGVNSDYFSAIPRKREDCELTFVGVMDYPPNIEAVCYFVRNVWPRILAQLPKARFTIVGAKPAAEVRALGQEHGVTVTGYVEDIRPFLARSSLAIVPLAIARGIQNKILEAIAAGVPVLTTPLVASNLPVQVTEAIHVAERTPVEFAESILGILKCPKQAEEKAIKAMELIRSLYSWETKGQQFEDLILRVTAGSEI